MDHVTNCGFQGPTPRRGRRESRDSVEIAQKAPIIAHRYVINQQRFAGGVRSSNGG